MASEKRCPDCAVRMERMKIKTNYGIWLSSGESRDGLIGSLGAKKKFDIVPYVCPECRLTRLYADS